VRISCLEKKLSKQKTCESGGTSESSKLGFDTCRKNRHVQTVLQVETAVYWPHASFIGSIDSVSNLFFVMLSRALQMR
jgi:hypothetical protein